MNVTEAAAALGVSERRVRALIQSERVAARKVDGVWQLDSLPTVRSRRPLSAASRTALSEALTNRALGSLTGQERARTAERVRQLRESADPGALLVDWWGFATEANDLGSQLARHAVEGSGDFVAETIRSRPTEYLRDPADLADVVSSERAIQGWSRQQLAAIAGVDGDVVLQIERARSVPSPGRILKVLAALNIEASALPDVVLT